MGTVKKYCPDCGSRLDYNPMISSWKAPNEFRIMVYRCKKCTNEYGRDVLVIISRRIIPEKNMWDDIRTDIFEILKK